MKKRIKDVSIIGQDHKGRGIARIEDKVIFVEKALPNEICDIEIKKETTKYLEATILKKTKNRSIVPPCPYYEFCGGCDILHQTYEEQLIFKEKKVQEILHKFADIDISVKPIVYENQYFYRNKITLHNLGLYQKNTKISIPIEECQLVHPRINEIIKRLYDYSKKFNDIIEYAMIRVSNQGEILLDVSGKIQKKKFQKYFNDIAVLLVNRMYLTEKRDIIDQINQLNFHISNTSFYQVNCYVTSKLYALVLDVYKNKKINNILDLYCGTGTISLLVALFVKNVIGIEVVKEAIENANHNKIMNHIENVEFICGRVEDYISTFSHIDGIIVDPPRVGLDSKTINSILTIAPQVITYVSCDTVTLARDLKKLKEKYEIIEVIPVDMFPNTHHVECVCVLRLR